MVSNPLISASGTNKLENQLFSNILFVIIDCLKNNFGLQQLIIYHIMTLVLRKLTSVLKLFKLTQHYKSLIFLITVFLMKE